ALLACALPGFIALQPLDRDESRFVQATTQMCETDLLFRESVISVAAQATHMPVGSSEGAPMRRKAKRSSTDMVRCCMAVSGVVLF
ncbi:MAG: hypothetical protein ACK5YO_39470, partial [Planctomyces sp.]